MKLLNQINTMERLDQLIRLRATGSLDELAYKLDISVSTVKRNIEAMKTLNFTGCSIGMPHKQDVIKYLDEIRFLSNSSSANIEIEQSEKLENLLLHAYNNIPYYHKVLQYVEVVKNGRVLLENFEKIPILTKELIRNNFEDLKSKDVNKRKWYYNASGGSTGKPLRII